MIGKMHLSHLNQILFWLHVEVARFACLFALAHVCILWLLFGVSHYRTFGGITSNFKTSNSSRQKINDEDNTRTKKRMINSYLK